MRATVVRAIDRLGLLVEWLTIFLTAVLVVIVTANVFARYVLQVGLLWSEEVSRLTFVWIVFLGAFMTLRRRGHLALTLLYDRFSPKAQHVVRLLGSVLVLAFLAVLAWNGIELVLQTLRFKRTTAILGISAAWGYLSVPAASFLMSLEVMRQILLGENTGGAGEATADSGSSSGEIGAGAETETSVLASDKKQSWQ